MLQKIVSLVLACAFFAGAVAVAGTSKAADFSILGASVTVDVQRGGVTLPATLVPALEPGDTVEISFPKGVQFSRSPRWHLIVADMHDDYLQYPPSFPIRDADLSRAPAGHVWRIPVAAGTTPIVFLVPEDGSRHGHGMPDARAAIDALANRSLLLKTAMLSAGAAAKASTMDEFLRSLAQIQPGELPDGRARVAAATQSLFGYDLGSASCFTTGIAQSTQYACAAQAVAQGYDSAPKASPVAAVGTQLSVNTATYGMLIGALYDLLAKRRVAAHYIFIPGVIKPGSANTNVYVDQAPSYDATAAKPSTIVYFEIGSQALNGKHPALGPAPALPMCLTGKSLTVAMPFNGLPVYFHAERVVLRAGKESAGLAATYDPLRGFHSEVDPAAFAALAAGGTATVQSQWGFATLESPPVRVIEPHPATWTLQTPGNALVSGDAHATLTFTDGGAGMGSCVHGVVVDDAVGRALPVTKIERESDRVVATVDATAAIGPSATASVEESNEPPGAALAITLFPAMPSVSSAIAYLPHGTLVLRGTGLKYIATVTLERTGIAFSNGTPNADGSWTFTADAPATYQPQWEHETMAISYTLVPPDTRTGAVEADVRYAP